MSTFYKDLNFELTQHNQRMRLELNSYRNELIKVRRDLMMQREASTVLKNTLTSEFLKVSQSFNIILRLLENTCNDSINETISEINSSLNNSKFDAETSKIDYTINSNRNENIRTSSTREKDSYNIDDTSLSNFSFEVENEEGTTIAEPVDMNISEHANKVNADDHCDISIPEESIINQSGMTVIDEVSEDNEIESPIRSNNELTKTLKEDSFIIPSTPPTYRSTAIRKTSSELTPSNIPLRNCSVLLHPIKLESQNKQSPRSTLKNITASLENIKDEKLPIISKKAGRKIILKHENPQKSAERRLLRRNAAPTVLTEQSIRTKLRR